MKNIFKNAFKDARGHLKKGNIFMLAVAFILGTVFGALVSSFANDILMGFIKHVANIPDNNEWVVSGMNIGKFLGALIYFVVVTAFVFLFLFIYFLIIRYIAYRKELKNPTPVKEPEAPKPTTEELILAELKQLNEKLSQK
ncbi:large conductance mechanosensitive channel protein MscL [Mycoplasmopsis sturni]|uniref:large conductance mechanosensitive channel protein MscL n=1 Tax=Mycoplasmopsis sturni TaxID=39047 RepID=UPI000A04E906|nr:MscL family protein [Mycoplasmopsis sturni]